MSTKEPIFQILGEPVSAISFVHDYVEIHFDGLIFRALSGPKLTLDGAQLEFPQSGSRDGLCNLIGHKVKTVDIIENSRIELHFYDGGKIEVAIHPSATESGESAHFVDSMNGTMDVF